MSEDLLNENPDPDTDEGAPTGIPERKLIRAVIREAVRDYVAEVKENRSGAEPVHSSLHGEHNYTYRRRLQRLAEISSTFWFFEEKRPQRPFSFDWCCERLGLDVERMREELLTHRTLQFN